MWGSFHHSQAHAEEKQMIFKQCLKLALKMIYLLLLAET